MEAKNNDLIKSLIKTAQGGTATLSRKSVMWLHKEEGEDAGQAKARWLLCGHELTWKQAVGLCFLQQHSASLGRAQRKWVIGTELSKHCGIGAITVIRPYTTVGGAGEEMSKFGAEGWEESQEPALALATCGHWQAFCKPATSSSRSQITGGQERRPHTTAGSLWRQLWRSHRCVPGAPASLLAGRASGWEDETQSEPPALLCLPLTRNCLQAVTAALSLCLPVLTQLCFGSALTPNSSKGFWETWFPV